MAYSGEYRTKSGKNTFKFSFVRRQNGTIRPYITRQPSYGYRSRDGHSTHRHGVNSRPYVCYDPMPRNLSDAVNIAKNWSEHTEKYINTGRW
jgi:hypothetical protein